VEQIEEKEQSSKPEASHRHEDEVAAPRMEGESADFDADEAQQVQDYLCTFENTMPGPDVGRIKPGVCLNGCV
jgi:hypothetical protein